MIRVRNLSKTYRQGRRDITALDNVDLDIAAGEVFGVLGRSGAGKSTLARCMNLLERPTSGTIEIDGDEITALSDRALRTARQRIGVVFQHVNLLSSRTAAANVAYPLEVAGLGKAERATRVAELLELVGIADRANAYPAQLSGGQRQRVGIARALAAHPSVLLCDEATSALDPETTQSIVELLRDLNQRLDLTILLITHEMAVARALCDTVAVMDAGRVVESGTFAALGADPSSLLRTKFLSDMAGPAAVQADLTFADGVDAVVLGVLAERFGLDTTVLGATNATTLQVALPRPPADDEVEYLRDAGVTISVTGERR